MLTLKRFCSLCDDRLVDELERQDNDFIAIYYWFRVIAMWMKDETGELF